MHRPVAFAPRHACSSYPLCQNSQKKKGSDGSRQRLEYCELCLSSRPLCAAPDCTRLAAPGSGRYDTDLCVIHYSDPFNATRRVWKLCCNSRLGCRQLSQTPRSGKCFACAQGCPPCAHSLSGCSAHIRSPTKTPLARRGCCNSGLNGMCTFDYSDPQKCTTPLCGQPRTSLTSSTCSDCSLGRYPCSNICSRRCVPSFSASQRLCQLCSSFHCSEAASTAAEVQATHARPVEEHATHDIGRSVHRPMHTCSNFPFCRKAQKQSFSIRCDGHAFIGRHSFCASCLKVSEKGRICSHSNCKNPPAPCNGGKDSNGLCSAHVMDHAHAVVREWPLCRNMQENNFVSVVRSRCVRTVCT